MDAVAGAIFGIVLLTFFDDMRDMNHASFTSSTITFISIKNYKYKLNYKRDTSFINYPHKVRGEQP